MSYGTENILKLFSDDFSLKFSERFLWLGNLGHLEAPWAIRYPKCPSLCNFNNFSNLSQWKNLHTFLREPKVFLSPEIFPHKKIHFSRLHSLEFFKKSNKNSVGISIRNETCSASNSDKN